MVSIKRFALILAALFAAGMIGNVSASAQALRTWVSGIGDDTATCSRTAPCKTFAGALPKTAAGGEINCLDSAGFGQLTITKSIAIVCDDVGQVSILAFNGGPGIVINTPPGSFVTLSGLFVDGARNAGFSESDGIWIVQGGTVSIRNSTITGFGLSDFYYGVNFRPTATAALVLDNVTLTENGSHGGFSSGGLLVTPAAGVAAKVTINNSRIQHNSVAGVRFDTVGIVGSLIRATITNSVISDDDSGLLAKAPAGTGTVRLSISGTAISENGGYGLIANGSGASVRIGKSVISGNGTALLALSGAGLASYNNNQLDGNDTDGAFTGTVLPGR